MHFKHIFNTSKALFTMFLNRSWTLLVSYDVTLLLTWPATQATSVGQVKPQKNINLVQKYLQ